MQLRVQRAHAASHSISGFDLSQDLGFAHDHGIKAGGYAKDMTHGLALAVFIEMACQQIGISLKVFAQKSAEVEVGSAYVDDQLHPVAGGKNHSLFHPGKLHQARRGVGEARLRYGQPLPHLHGGALVVHADENKGHGPRNLCVPLR